MIVIGFLGTVLDSGPKTNERWNKWRPTISICQQDDFIVHTLELLLDKKHDSLAQKIIQDIGYVSPETTVRLHYIDFKNPWDFEEVYETLLDFASHYPFDTDNHQYAVHLTTGTHVAQICMFLLSEARYFPAQLLQSSPSAQKGGIGQCSLIDLDISKYDRLAQRFEKEQQQATHFLKSGIPTRNAEFNTLIDEIEQVVIKTTAPVLLMGQTGVGKSRLAKQIYELKKKRHHITGAFIEVNCATLKGDGAMSTLFGHKKGSFTGAITDRAGLLMAAHKGVLFLDEIGELGLDEQAMMLTAIEEKRFRPMGSDKETHSDFQLIAGTNKDLYEQVTKGHFREDLLARLDLWAFCLPPLKQRKEDIEPNMDYEIQSFGLRNNQKITMNKEAREAYLKFALSDKAIWPANFRDLSASVYRMATLSQSGRITLKEVQDDIKRLQNKTQHYHAGSAEFPLVSALIDPETLETVDLFDKIQLEQVLKVCQTENSLSSAGRTLFSASREAKTSTNDANRLSKYLARFGVTWTEIKASKS